MSLRDGLVRKNVNMSIELAKWYEDMAKSLGISQSGLMVMALKQYIDQQEALQVSRMVPEWLASVQEIQERENEKEK